MQSLRVDELQDFVAAKVDAAQPVACICHHGARSAQVVAFLLRQGYPRVYNLAGGVDAWSTQVDRAVPRY
jgi:rhodanese-related sulfurtransferase